MIDDYKVSIIVPIFNTDQYLELCISQLLEQSYKNIEILLIDDGSSDESANICLKYKNKDERIKYIKQKNQGQSVARNRGLDIANGDYIMFCDSDDMVSKYYVENLLNAVINEKCNVGISKFLEIGEDIKNVGGEKSDTLKRYSVEDGLRNVLYQRNGLDIAPWGKIFEASLFENVRFPEGKVHEDLATIYIPILKGDGIVVVDSFDYYYRQNFNSTVHKKFSINKIDCIQFANQMYYDIVKIYPQLESACACRVISAICNIYKQIPCDEYNDVRLECWTYIRKYRYSVLSDHEARLKARVAALISYLGKGIFEHAFMLIR